MRTCSGGCSPLDASNPAGRGRCRAVADSLAARRVVVIGGALVILGHAAAGHGSVILAGAVGLGLAGAATTVLARIARESTRPDR